MAASLILRGKPYVSMANRKKILKGSHELGYQPDLDCNSALVFNPMGLLYKPSVVSRRIRRYSSHVSLLCHSQTLF